MKSAWNDYVLLMKKEIVPALGCTEPVAVALAAATAMKYLKDFNITAINVLVSPNLMKNGMGVGVPGTGMKGLPIAAAAGACGGDAEAKLEVLKGLNTSSLERACAMLKAGIVKVGIKETDMVLYVECEVKSRSGSVTVIIEDEHTKITSIIRDGENIFTLNSNGESGNSKDESLHLLAKNTRVEDIWDFAMNAPLDMISFVNSAAEINGRIAKAGLEEEFGLRIGRTMHLNEIRGILARDLMTEVMKRSSAASDARMDGCELPVMTNSGSGNQGITATLPVATAAEFFNSSPEELTRALVLSNFIAIHIKSHLNKLSALCAVIVAAMGASCGIVYLMGGSEKQCEYAIENMIGDLSGMICDGAKSGCALKVSSAVSASVKAALLAMGDIRISCEEGIIAHDVEEVINNLGFLASDGMKQTDEKILEIMTSKKPRGQQCHCA